MIHLIKTYKNYVIVGLFIIFAGIYFLFQPTGEQDDLLIDEEEWLEMENEDELGSVVPVEEIVEEIIVDVKGAVKAPGVYEAELDERVIDMIEKAGGLTETADEGKINFAIKVEDEMVIYVPELGEEMEVSSDGFPLVSGSTNDDGKVNINTANEGEFQTLPGIGPSKARTIIEFREQNGPFKDIEDLKLISGIGEKSFEKLQNQIKVK